MQSDLDTRLSFTQGNIVEWKKKEGDELASGDILCMIETDKVRAALHHTCISSAWHQWLMHYNVTKQSRQSSSMNDPLFLISGRL